MSRLPSAVGSSSSCVCAGRRTGPRLSFGWGGFHCSRWNQQPLGLFFADTRPPRISREAYNSIHSRKWPASATGITMSIPCERGKPSRVRRKPAISLSRNARSAEQRHVLTVSRRHDGAELDRRRARGSRCSPFPGGARCRTGGSPWPLAAALTAPSPAPAGGGAMAGGAGGPSGQGGASGQAGSGGSGTGGASGAGAGGQGGAGQGGSGGGAGGSAGAGGATSDAGAPDRPPSSGDGALAGLDAASAHRRSSSIIPDRSAGGQRFMMALGGTTEAVTATVQARWGARFVVTSYSIGRRGSAGERDRALSSIPCTPGSPPNRATSEKCG